MTAEGPSNPEMISIIVPTFREAENIPPLVEGIAAVLDPLGSPYEIIIVDDDSRDGTDRQVEQLAAAGRPVRLITRTDERGLSTAVVRGFTEARGQILACMDADGSHPPSALPAMLEALGDGETDFAVASRYASGGTVARGWGLMRRINSGLATLLARPFTKVKDPMSGFFALRRGVYERAAKLDPVGYKIGLELLVKCPLRSVREVPIHFADRQHGQSKLNWRQRFAYLRHLQRLARFKYATRWRFVLFCLVGGSGVVVDLSSYALLLAARAPHPAARAVAIWIAMTWNFIWNRRITFGDRGGSAVRQYPRYVASSALGALLSWSVCILLVAHLAFFDRYKLLAAAVGIAAGIACNFLLSLLWVFRPRGSARPSR